MCFHFLKKCHLVFIVSDKWVILPFSDPDMGLLSNPRAQEKIVNVLKKYANALCVLCYVAGVVWFLALAYKPLNAGTYFSENALLPGVFLCRKSITSLSTNLEPTFWNSFGYELVSDMNWCNLSLSNCDSPLSHVSFTFAGLVEPDFYNEHGASDYLKEIRSEMQRLIDLDTTDNHVRWESCEEAQSIEKVQCVFNL